MRKLLSLQDAGMGPMSVSSPPGPAGGDGVDPGQLYGEAVNQPVLEAWVDREGRSR